MTVPTTSLPTIAPARRSRFAQGPKPAAPLGVSSQSSIVSMPYNVQHVSAVKEALPRFVFQSDALSTLGVWLQEITNMAATPKVTLDKGYKIKLTYSANNVELKKMLKEFGESSMVKPKASYSAYTLRVEKIPSFIMFIFKNKAPLEPFLDSLGAYIQSESPLAKIKRIYADFTDAMEQLDPTLVAKTPCIATVATSATQEYTFPDNALAASVSPVIKEAIKKKHPQLSIDTMQIALDRQGLHIETCFDGFNQFFVDACQSRLVIPKKGNIPKSRFVVPKENIRNFLEQVVMFSDQGRIKEIETIIDEVRGFFLDEKIPVEQALAQMYQKEHGEAPTVSINARGIDIQVVSKASLHYPPDKMFSSFSNIAPYWQGKLLQQYALACQKQNENPLIEKCHQILHDGYLKTFGNLLPDKTMDVSVFR